MRWPSNQMIYWAKWPNYVTTWFSTRSWHTSILVKMDDTWGFTSQNISLREGIGQVQWRRNVDICIGLQEMWSREGSLECHTYHDHRSFGFYGLLWRAPELIFLNACAFNHYRFLSLCKTWLEFGPLPPTSEWALYQLS